MKPPIPAPRSTAKPTKEAPPDEPTLKHARRQLRENYLATSDLKEGSPANAANEWYHLVGHTHGFSPEGEKNVEVADHETADVVESALWSARYAK